MTQNAIEEALFSLIRRMEPGIKALGPETDLYRDGGMDSLSFVALLMEIERAFDIRFSLAEMGRCVRIEQLVQAIAHKMEAKQ